MVSNQKKNNPIPKPIKFADLKYNSDFTRLVTITEKDLERIEKYREAIQLL